MSSSQPQKIYGMTPPISTAQPTVKEIQATERLVTTLKELGLFESEEESRKRYDCTTPLVLAASSSLHMATCFSENSFLESLTLYSKNL